MKEYIERAAALDICQKEYEERLRMADYCGDTVAWNIGGAIKSIPAADVAEVRHGRWEYIAGTANTYSRLRCNCCGWWTLDPSVNSVYHFCPNCGARMGKEADHEVSEP